MFEPDPTELSLVLPGRRRRRSWALLAASALAHAAILAWLCLARSPAPVPMRAIDVVLFNSPPRPGPAAPLSPRQREAERERQAYLDRLTQPVAAPQAETTAPPPAPDTPAAGAAAAGGAPDPGDSDAPLEAGGNVTRPVLVSGAQPGYTRAAQIAGLEGDVVLKAVIDERGRVTHLEVLRGLGLGLDDAAVESVRRWRFKPSTRAGKPVKVFYVLTVHFRL